MCFSRCGGGNWDEFLAKVLRGDNGKYAAGQPSYENQEEEPILRSWLGRGLTRAMLRKWAIVWDKVAGAMRIPCFSEQMEEIGCMWRSPEGVEPKYRYQTGMRKGQILFGLWRLPQVLPKLVLVEGPLDALWVQEAGWPAVAILGSSVSDYQAALALKRGVRKVILCFDNDEAGKRAEEQATRLFRREGLWVLRVQLPRQYKDIQEVPIQRVPKLLAHPELCVNGTGFIAPRFKRWARR